MAAQKYRPQNRSRTLLSKTAAKNTEASRKSPLLQMVTSAMPPYSERCALSFEPTLSGMLVRMWDQPSLPVSEWTAREDGPAGVGALMRLRDDGSAVEQADARSLLVDWDERGWIDIRRTAVHRSFPTRRRFALEGGCKWITTGRWLQHPLRLHRSRQTHPGYASHRCMVASGRREVRVA